MLKVISWLVREWKFAASPNLLMSLDFAKVPSIYQMCFSDCATIRIDWYFMDDTPWVLINWIAGGLIRTLCGNKVLDWNVLSLILGVFTELQAGSSIGSFLKWTSMWLSGPNTHKILFSEARITRSSTIILHDSYCEHSPLYLNSNSLFSSSST